MDEPDATHLQTPAPNHNLNDDEGYDSGPGTHGQPEEMINTSIPTNILNN